MNFKEHIFERGDYFCKDGVNCFIDYCDESGFDNVQEFLGDY